MFLPTEATPVRSQNTHTRRYFVHAFVSSRVDYCNSVFAGSVETVVKKLQSVQNAAARLIACKKRNDHITPVLRDELHWLPVRERIHYKIALTCLLYTSPSP